MDYYADSRAPEEGAGTLDRPWRSIAANVNKLKPGDTLWLRGALDHRLPYTEASIEIEVSGAKDAPIRMLPYEEERVVLLELSGEQTLLRVRGDHIQVGGGDPSRMLLDRAGRWPYLAEYRGRDGLLWGVELVGNRGCSRGVVLNGERNTVRTCDVHSMYNGDNKDAVGVEFRDGPGHVIEGCRIWDIAGNGIGAWDGHTPTGWMILNNEIWTAIAPCSEQGIDVKYNAGVRALIAWNRLHGFRACPSECGGSGSPFGDGILVHNSADLVTVEYNEVWDCGGGVRVDDLVVDTVVRRNVLRDLIRVEDDPNGHAWAMYGLFLRGINTEVYHNTVVGSPVHSMVLHEQGNGWVRNNAFAHCGDTEIRGGEFEFDHNGWWDCGLRVEGEGDVLGDPLFEDEEGRDFRLREGSPYIWTGASLGGVEKPSLGAFEFVEGGDGMGVVEDLRALQDRMTARADDITAMQASVWSTCQALEAATRADVAVLDGIIAGLSGTDDELDALRGEVDALRAKVGTLADAIEED